MTANHVLGVVEDPRLDTLATDLRSAGLNEFSMTSAQDEGDNTVARVIEQIKHRDGDNSRAMEVYENEARTGNPIVAITVQGDIDAGHAIDVLERNHVSHIQRFGD